MNLSKAFLAAALLASCAWLPGQAQTGPKVIAIAAKRFEYSPKEIRLKKGETVTLVLTSGDVTHGFLCRPLKIDTDIPPSQETRVTVTPDKTGEFVAICNHFCGSGHGNMKMKIIVE
jgi:cytochrome c oxidase subunit II